jgi:hypothetical protein
MSYFFNSLLKEVFVVTLGTNRIAKFSQPLAYVRESKLIPALLGDPLPVWQNKARRWEQAVAGSDPESYCAFRTTDTSFSRRIYAFFEAS